MLLICITSLFFAAPVQAVKPAPPTAPSNPSAIGVSASQINLTWRDNSSNESGFMIQRGPSSAGPWSLIATVSANTTVYSNTGLSAGTTYYYRVCAYNSRGYSSYSSAASAPTMPAAGCTYSISPTNASFTFGGGSASVSITTGAGCAWTATSGATWITITVGASGSGNGTVSYSVGANASTSPRSGNLTIAGYTFTVNQAGAPCTYSISPTNASFTSSGGSGSAGVTAGAGCSWSATSTATWITVTAGTSGSGNGTVSYSVGANSSTSPRSGTLTIAAQNFTVDQGAAPPPCSYSIFPPSASFGAGGGSGSVNVTASASTCPWPASTTYSWITIISGVSGVGNGTVSYSVAANTSTSPRTGDITIAGQTFTVSEAAATVDNPPTATLTAPSSGTTISGIATFSGTASDDIGVARVEFWCDGTLLVGTDTTAPYSVTYNTTNIPNGSHSFTCKAYDTTGKSTTSAAVSAMVNNGSATSGQPLWVKTILSPAGYAAESRSVAADASANVIVAGDFIGTVDFGGGPSPNTGNYNAFIAKYTGQGGLLWSKTFGGLGNDSASAVAVDSRTNVIVTGFFTGTADFGGVPMIASDPFGIWARDIFVAKYSPSGSLIWVRQFGGSESDFGYAVAVDRNDNVIVAGGIQSANVNFGSGVSLSNLGVVNVAVVKLSPSGTTLWAKVWGGGYEVMARGVAIDRSGDVVITGQFQGGAALGGATILGAVGVYSTFVAKYSGVDGSYRWARGFGASSVDGGRGITTDPNTGNVVVAGAFTGAADFGGGPVPSSTGGAFLAAYDPSGNYLWHRTYGGTSGSSDWGSAVKIDATGNLVITGCKGTPWNVGGTLLWGTGAFAMSCSISGNAPPVLLWLKIPGTSSTGGSVGNGVAVDSFGHVLTTGKISSGTVDFGGISATTPSGSTSGFVVQYSN